MKSISSHTSFSVSTNILTQVEAIRHGQEQCNNEANQLSLLCFSIQTNVFCFLFFFSLYKSLLPTLVKILKILKEQHQNAFQFRSSYTTQLQLKNSLVKIPLQLGNQLTCIPELNRFSQRQQRQIRSIISGYLPLLTQYRDCSKNSNIALHSALPM